MEEQNKIIINQLIFKETGGSLWHLHNPAIVIGHYLEQDLSGSRDNNLRPSNPF